MNEKQTIKAAIFTAFGIVLLVIAILGSAFAMFSFTGTGTKEVFIRSGKIKLDFANTSSLSLQNQYPLSDQDGISQTGENAVLEFDVVSELDASMRIDYALRINVVEEGEHLTKDYVKIYVTKDGELLSGFTADTGRAISSFASNQATNLYSDYVLDTDYFTTNGNHKYIVKAWISDEYKLPIDSTGNSTISENFTFKIDLKYYAA